jgi:hypothetical protein
VIDFRSFTPARGLPARTFPNNFGVCTVRVRPPHALVIVSPAFRRWRQPAWILGGGYEERVLVSGT